MISSRQFQHPINSPYHYSDVIIGAMASQITSLAILYSTVYSGRRRSKKTSTLRVTGLCVRGIHRWPMNYPHKWSIWWRHHKILGTIEATRFCMIVSLSLWKSVRLHARLHICDIENDVEIPITNLAASKLGTSWDLMAKIWHRIFSQPFRM